MRARRLLQNVIGQPTNLSSRAGTKEGNGIKFYELEDSTKAKSGNAEFNIYGELDKNGRLAFSVRTETKAGDERAFWSAGAEFDKMVAHFGKANINELYDMWSYGSNLEQFNAIVEAGGTTQLAAENTWTATQARKIGLTKVKITLREPDNDTGPYTKISVVYSK